MNWENWMFSLVYSSNTLHFLFSRRLDGNSVSWKILSTGLDAEFRTNEDWKRIKGNYFITCRLPPAVAHKELSWKFSQMLQTLTWFQKYNTLEYIKRYLVLQMPNSLFATLFWWVNDHMLGNIPLTQNNVVAKAGYTAGTAQKDLHTSWS